MSCVPLSGMRRVATSFHCGTLLCVLFLLSSFLVSSWVDKASSIVSNRPFKGVSNIIMPRSMADEHIRAVLTHGAGGPEVLSVGEHPKPFAGPGKVLIKIYAAGLNGADLMQRAGRYGPPPGGPHVLGLEAAGEVVEDHSEDPRFKKGDRVMSLLDGGGYSEYVAAAEGLMMPIPEPLSYEEAAGIPEGEDLLIHAGASGVGTAAIQLAKAWGARVFVTAGSDEKCQLAKDLGADVAINHKKEDFLEVLKAKTADKKGSVGNGWGVDVILDLVGAVHFEKNIDSLSLEGRLLFVGTGGGVEAQLNISKVMMKRLKLIGSTLRARPLRQKTKLTQEFAEFALPKFKDGTFKSVVDKVFPIEDVRKAHEYMDAKQNKGKIILKIDH